VILFGTGAIKVMNLQGMMRSIADQLGQTTEDNLLLPARIFSQAMELGRRSPASK
jgi:hypothetical protein